ncbi:Foldase protein PrsA [Nymphon striatum]|nr:Foldase protein PrsA [Nymphon striatum]
MISDMSWAQKQQLLKNDDKFQGLLLQYLTLKKQAKEAKNRQLDSNELVKWKLEKQKSQLLAKELIDNFQKNIKIPESVEAIALAPDASKEKVDDTLDKANKLISEIKEGLNFEIAAKEHSDDKRSAVDGGRINAFPRGQMVPPFEEAAFSMKTIGEISEPIKTRFGYHIIKLTSRIEAGHRPYKEVGPLLIKKERDKYLKSKTDEFLSGFSSNKNTTIYMPALQLLLQEESSKHPLNKPLK